MRNVALIDAGPIIALFNRDDRFHTDALSALRDFRGTLITTWPAIAEAIYMLAFSVEAQIALLEWIEREGRRVAYVHCRTREDHAYLQH